MKNTREIIKEFTINNKEIPMWVKNYLDGKRDLNKTIALYLEEYFGLPRGTIEYYDKEYNKWLNEVVQWNN